MLLKLATPETLGTTVSNVPLFDKVPSSNQNWPQKYAKQPIAYSMNYALAQEVTMNVKKYNRKTTHLSDIS